MDRRSLKQNYNEFLAMNLLEIHCSSRSSCFSCVLRLRRFVVEVLRGFWGLNPWNFIDFWLFEVSGGFWAWFQWTLRSGNMIWMIPLWMFFDFGVEVLEGFEAWFLQSFCTSECFWIFSDAACALNGLVSFKCLRNASIYRSLGVGERHVVELDWCHRLHVHWCVIGFCMTLGKFFLASALW